MHNRRRSLKRQTETHLNSWNEEQEVEIDVQPAHEETEREENLWNRNMMVIT
jgi:hypothetical protein